MQMVNLGRTGMRVSKLGYGTGTHGWSGASDETRIGHDNLVKLIRLGYEKGITLWDVADAYGSHPHTADALKGLDRSSVTIMTKTHSKSPDEVRANIPRFLKELRTDYIDILLLHCITNQNWLNDYSELIKILEDAKKNGTVKAIGISCHDFGVLKTVASAEWVDVILARINYDSVNMDAKTEEVVPILEDIHNAGKGVIGMKIVGQGKLHESVEKAFKFALGLSCVDAFVVGMVSENQIIQNLSLMN